MAIVEVYQHVCWRFCVRTNKIFLKIFLTVGPLGWTLRKFGLKRRKTLPKPGFGPRKNPTKKHYFRQKIRGNRGFWVISINMDGSWRVGLQNFFFDFLGFFGVWQVCFAPFFGLYPPPSRAFFSQPRLFCTNLVSEPRKPLGKFFVGNTLPSRYAAPVLAACGPQTGAGEGFVIRKRPFPEITLLFRENRVLNILCFSDFLVEKKFLFTRN